MAICIPCSAFLVRLFLRQAVCARLLLDRGLKPPFGLAYVAISSLRRDPVLTTPASFRLALALNFLHLLS